MEEERETSMIDKAYDGEVTTESQRQEAVIDIMMIEGVFYWEKKPIPVKYNGKEPSD